MNSERRRLLAITVLALCLAGAGSCSGLQGGGGSSEALALPFLLDASGKLAWNPGHHAENKVQRVDEYVHPGETVENWTQLVSVETFNKAAGLSSLEDQLAAARKEIVSRCPGSTLEVLRKTPDGVLYEEQAVHCPTGADEHILARVFDGNSNRFVVMYSVRGSVTMTSERRDEWIEKLMAVQMLTSQ